MMTNFDDRVHVLMARLADATPVAPAFEVLDTWATPVHPATPRAARRWVPLVAAAATVALVAGVIAIDQLRDAVPSSHDRHSTLQLATNLPEGWELVKAVGPGTHTDEASSPEQQMTVYATDRAPLGPVVGLTAGAYGFNGREFTNTTATTLPDGRRVSLSDTRSRTRWADVEVAPGTWVGLESRDVTDEVMLRLAGSIEYDGVHAPTLAADAIAATGLSAIGLGVPSLAPFVYTPDSDATMLPTGVTAIRYNAPTLTGDVEVAAFVASPTTRALLGLFSELSEVDGAVVGPYPGSVTRVGYYAEHDGVAFYATGPSSRLDEIRRIVGSFAPVSDAEWRRAVGRTPLEPLGTTPTSVESTPVPEGPFTTTVEVTTSVTPTATAGEYAVVLSAPGLPDTRFTVGYVGRTITVRSDPAFGDVQSAVIDVRPRSSGSWVFPDAPAAIVMLYLPEGDPAVRMSLVVDGTRYLVDLVQPDPSYPVRLGVLLVPTTGTSGRLQPVLLDKDGTARPYP
jgi:hypothetical protein